MSNFELANLMQHLSAAMQKLSANEVALLLANKASVDILVTPTSKGHPVSKSGTTDTLNISQITNQLDAALSREEGATELKTLSKTELQLLAKHFSVSVDSSANKEKLIEKIVERKVGLRLRQNAFSQVMSAA
ncbi:MAG: hypothetical protein WBK51_18275 [Polaromonas sp.]